MKQLTLRIIGFVASLILTLIAFWIIVNPALFHLQKGPAIWAIIILALIQSVVQSIFFLKLLDEKGPPWHLGVFISTLSIIFVIVFFSIWIMNHLNYNMMP